MALSAWLAAPNALVAALAATAVALPASRRPQMLGIAVVALAGAVGVAVHDGAAPAAAPLWGVGVLVAGGLAERALTLPDHGEIEVAALVAWLAALAAIAGAGLAAAAVVLLAAGTSVGTSVAGLVAGVALAILPAAMARRWRSLGDPR